MAEDTAGLDLLLTNSRLEKPKANIHAMSPVPIGFLADGHPARLAEAVVPTVTVTELGELPVTLTDAGTLQTGSGRCRRAYTASQIHRPAKRSCWRERQTEGRSLASRNRRTGSSGRYAKSEIGRSNPGSGQGDDLR